MEKYALAFVHVPSGEVGRSEFVFTSRENVQSICDELDKECPSILHFVLSEHDNIRINARMRKEYARSK